MPRSETPSSSETEMPIAPSGDETKIAEPLADAGMTLDAVPDQPRSDQQNVDQAAGGTIMEDSVAAKSVTASAVQIHSHGVIRPVGEHDGQHMIDEQAETLIQPNQPVLDPSQDASREDHEVPSIMATMVEQARAAQEVRSGATVSAMPFNVAVAQRSTASKQSYDNETRVGGAKPASPKREGMTSGADRYQLLDNFAHGGLGNIWKAEDKAIRREVAFKELLPRRSEIRRSSNGLSKRHRSPGSLSIPESCRFTTSVIRKTVLRSIR